MILRNRQALGGVSCKFPVSGYITGYIVGSAVKKTSQRRAIDNYRDRLSKRGMVRFEVIGRDIDRELVRSVARRLAEGGPAADRLRAAVDRTISGTPPGKGGILKALLQSPLADSGLDLTRPREEGREVDI